MRLSVLLFAAGMLCALPAHADDMFTINSGSNTVTFTVPSTGTPVMYNAMAFELWGLTIDVNGVALNDQAIDFYTAADGGGLEVQGLDPFRLNLMGDQLFTGSTADPTFSVGQFSLMGLSAGPFDGNLDLGITAAEAVAPEPSSFALLGTGMLGVEGTLRRRMV